MSRPQDVREIALAQPDTAELETWGHPTFRVGGHIFVGLDEDARTANVNATLEAQAALVGTKPDVFSVSPRVGKSGWVTIKIDALPVGELRELIVQAWDLTASKK